MDKRLGPKASSPDELFFTAVILLEPHENGTKYMAIVIHGDEASCKKHDEMGFHQGWGRRWINSFR